MAFIPEEIVEEIKARAEINDVVAPYVRLTKKSGTNQFGLCPFHQEKTPSFSVSTTKQIFYCFGCHKGGDAVTFIMEIEGLTYPEALQHLAEKYSIDIKTEESPEAQRSRSKHKRQFELHTEAARYFYKVFRSPQAKTAQDYLQNRGIDHKIATGFGLGYSSDAWDGLLNHLRSKGYSEEECETSGLFRRNRHGKLYDLFRERLIFPIIDAVGRIVGFGGRSLQVEEQAKYINSPETMIYHKGEELYALNIAKRSHADHLLLVEGYMDVLALHQAGIDQAVACLGTALTDDQAAKLARYKDHVVLCFDADNAGRQATDRSLDVVRRKGLEAFVLEIPDGLDPDDYLRQNGVERFMALLQKPLRATDYRLKRARAEAYIHGEFDLMLYKDNVLEVLKDLDDRVEIELRVKQLADELMVRQDLLHDQLRQLRRRKPAPQHELRKAHSHDERAGDMKEDLSRDPLTFTLYAMLANFTAGKPELYPQNLEAEDFPRSHHELAGNVLKEAKAGHLDGRRLLDLSRSYRVGREKAESLITAKLVEIRDARDTKQAESSIQNIVRRMKRDRINEEIADINRKLGHRPSEVKPDEIFELETRLQELVLAERKLRQSEV